MSKQKHVSTQVKIMRGTYKKCVDGNKLINKPAKELPVCPDYFDADTKEYWYDIVSTLQFMGILQSIGVRQIIIYCKHYEIYKKAIAHIDKYGITIVSKTLNGTILKKNPSIEVMNVVTTKMDNISDRFGFSPLSQSRIKNTQVGFKSNSEKQDWETDEIDPLGIGK